MGPESARARPAFLPKRRLFGKTKPPSPGAKPRQGSKHPAAVVRAFRFLGIPLSATPSEVKSAYRKRARRFHPDKGGSKELFTTLWDEFEIALDAAENRTHDGDQDDEFSEMDKKRHVKAFWMILKDSTAKEQKAFLATLPRNRRNLSILKGMMEWGCNVKCAEENVARESDRGSRKTNELKLKEVGFRRTVDGHFYARFAYEQINVKTVETTNWDEAVADHEALRDLLKKTHKLFQIEVTAKNLNKTMKEYFECLVDVFRKVFSTAKTTIKYFYHIEKCRIGIRPRRSSRQTSNLDQVLLEYKAYRCGKLTCRKHTDRMWDRAYKRLQRHKEALEKLHSKWAKYETRRVRKIRLIVENEIGLRGVPALGNIPCRRRIRGKTPEFESRLCLQNAADAGPQAPPPSPCSPPLVPAPEELTQKR
mmetsp:Transcript_80590/g.176754  ORF Transcript_80590/g.176754 Transcript_80590/m.176754 type:complete len:422 (-) Transcript_80590:501-1766(-)